MNVLEYLRQIFVALRLLRARRDAADIPEAAEIDEQLDADAAEIDRLSAGTVPR